MEIFMEDLDQVIQVILESMLMELIIGHTDAITGGGTYELIRSEELFTLYDNSSIRRAKIELTFPTTKIEWLKTGTEFGNILPCNPTKDIDICSSGTYNTSSGQQKVSVLTEGVIVGYGAYGNTSGVSKTLYDRSGFNGTYYWSY